MHAHTYVGANVHTCAHASVHRGTCAYTNAWHAYGGVGVLQATDIPSRKHKVPPSTGTASAHDAYGTGPSRLTPGPQARHQSAAPSSPGLIYPAHTHTHAHTHASARAQMHEGTSTHASMCTHLVTSATSTPPAAPRAATIQVTALKPSSTIQPQRRS